MASRYEGFPIAHGEALLCGVPVIATDCPSRPRRWFETHPPPGGIRELLRERSGSILVPPEDPATLAEVMARCMSDGILRARLANETRQAAERFSLPSVLHKWETLFAEVVSGRGR
jgi:GalNAc-alpha-(1->4)-GalNAc-alpha-(1->3)-diNAcBac-PP-undecaprenol alpha-1,4-N-acetyl-D-galactosaminyltransferase